MKHRLLLLSMTLLCCLPLGAQTLRDIASLDTLIAGADAAQKRELTLRKATLLKRMYLFDEAIEALTALLSPDRMDLELMGEIADCHYQAGNTAEAADLYALLTQLQPDNTGFQIRYLTLAYRAQAYETVVDMGRGIAAEVLPAAILVGDALVRLEQRDSALVYYWNALGRKPKNASLVSKMADIFLGRKEYDIVQALAGDYLKLDGSNPQVRQILGLTHYLKGEYEESERIFEQLLADGDDEYAVHYYLGQSYLQRRIYREAEEQFTAAWAADSSSVNLALAIGMVRSQYGRDGTAWFEKALAMLEPDPAQLAAVYRNYGLAEYRWEHWDRAIELYRKAYGLDPSQTSDLSTIGYCYEMKKDFRSARDWYERYLRLAKPGTQAYRFVEESLGFVKGELFMEE